MTFLLAKSIVSRSVPLNSISCPAGTVLWIGQHLMPWSITLLDKWETGKFLPPITNVSRGYCIFLPPQRYALTSMECKHNIVCDIRDTSTSIGRAVDSCVKLVIILNIWCNRSIGRAFVVNVDLSSAISGAQVKSVLEGAIHFV